MSARIETLWFGAPDEACLAHVHVPDVEMRGAVVLCPPIGYEAICTARAYRHLARRLADVGFCVVRFAYHGTGDSLGSDDDSNRWFAWKASLADAIALAKRASGADRVVLFGTRVGATLAAEVASCREDVAALGLFAPVVKGRQFVRELRAFRKLLEQETGPSRPSLRQEGDEEAAGFLFRAATLAAISSADLTMIPRGGLHRVFLVDRDDIPSGEDALAVHLKALSIEVDRDQHAGYAKMALDPHKSIIPDEIFARFVDWLSRHVEGRVARPPALEARPRLQTAHFSETALRLGARSLFAILTRPIAPVPGAPTVVLLNAGAIEHIGPNRSHVALARRLAARGIATVRLDLSGLGESDALPGAPENRVYSIAAVPDVTDAFDALEREHGLSRFALMGLCAGAYVSYYAAIDDKRVVSLALINPQTFVFREGDSLEIGARRGQNLSESRRYARRLLDTNAWRKLLRGDVAIAYAAKIAVGRGRDLIEREATRIGEYLGRVRPETAALRAGFAVLAERGVKTLLLFSSDDPGLEYVESRLGRQGVEVIEGPDHTFTPLWAQQLLEDRLIAFI